MYETRSPAVAERPRDASCLSASIVQYFERNLLLLVASASDLPLRTIKFCYVLFYSSWSSMLVVINKDPLMRGGVCGKLHGGRSQLLFALQQWAVIDRYIASYSSKIAICSFLPHLNSTPVRGVPVGLLPWRLLGRLWRWWSWWGKKSTTVNFKNHNYQIFQN